MASSANLTPEQKRLIDRLKGKSKSPFAGSPWDSGAYIDEAVTWVNEPVSGNVRINFDPPRKAQFMATRKFVANLVIEANTTDKYDQTVKVNLLAINLTSDDLADLLSKAHGHLELVSDK